MQRPVVPVTMSDTQAREKILDAAHKLQRTTNKEAEKGFRVVITGKGGLVEIQATAEQSAFSEAQFHELLKLAQKGAAELTAAQMQVLA